MAPVYPHHEGVTRGRLALIFSFGSMPIKFDYVGERLSGECLACDHRKIGELEAEGRVGAY